MWTELITLEMFFYHQSNAGLIMHSMQEITMIMIIMDIHIGSNTHTQPQTCHLSQGPARAGILWEK